MFYLAAFFLWLCFTCSKPIAKLNLKAVVSNVLIAVWENETGELPNFCQTTHSVCHARISNWTNLLMSQNFSRVFSVDVISLLFIIIVYYYSFAVAWHKSINPLTLSWKLQVFLSLYDLVWPGGKGLKIYLLLELN